MRVLEIIQQVSLTVTLTGTQSYMLTTPRHTVFLKIAVFEIVLLYKTFLRMPKKIDESIGAVDIYLLTSQKIFSATKLLFSFDLVKNSEEFTFTEKMVKNF